MVTRRNKAAQTKSVKPPQADASHAPLPSRRWFAALQEKWDWTSPPSMEIRKDLEDRFLRVSPHCELGPDNLEAAITAIAKGYALVRAARGWREPVAGPGNSATDRCRGEQWRLAMAWGGMETMFQALGSLKKRKGYQEVNPFAEITERLNLPPFDPIHPPNRKLTELERWLELGNGSERHVMLDYLGCKKAGESVEIIRKWLIDGEAVETWHDGLLLARAFRHATAHGALSANKVLKWGLRKVFERLNETLDTVANSIMERLAED